jgi:hypothetical protein
MICVKSSLRAEAIAGGRNFSNLPKIQRKELSWLYSEFADTSPKIGSFLGDD